MSALPSFTPHCHSSPLEVCKVTTLPFSPCAAHTKGSPVGTAVRQRHYTYNRPPLMTFYIVWLRFSNHVAVSPSTWRARQAGKDGTTRQGKGAMCVACECFFSWGGRRDGKRRWTASKTSIKTRTTRGDPGAVTTRQGGHSARPTTASFKQLAQVRVSNARWRRRLTPRPFACLSR
jgi:hypothetical protein